MPDPVRVLVLYSHPLMGQGLERMLAAEVGVPVEVVDGACPEAVATALDRAPQVVVLEEGGDVDAAEVVRRSRLRPPARRRHHARPAASPLRREALAAGPDAFLATIRADRPRARGPSARPGDVAPPKPPTTRRLRRYPALAAVPARLPPMGDATPRPGPRRTTFDPATTPVPRRRVLVLMGAGAIAAGGGLGVLLEACSAPPVPVDARHRPVDARARHPDRGAVHAHLGRQQRRGLDLARAQGGGEIVAFDPRCTHAQCAYAWSATRTGSRATAMAAPSRSTARVLAGPPPRPLDRFPAPRRRRRDRGRRPGLVRDARTSRSAADARPGHRRAKRPDAGAPSGGPVDTGPALHPPFRPVSQFYPPTDGNSPPRA